VLEPEGKSFTHEDRAQKGRGLNKAGDGVQDTAQCDLPDPTHPHTQDPDADSILTLGLGVGRSGRSRGPLAHSPLLLSGLRELWSP
jgi:hypothetical protein